MVANMDKKCSAQNITEGTEFELYGRWVVAETDAAFIRPGSTEVFIYIEGCERWFPKEKMLTIA